MGIGAYGENSESTTFFRQMGYRKLIESEFEWDIINSLNSLKNVMGDNQKTDVQVGDQLGHGEIATAADKSVRKLIETVSSWFGLDARPRLMKKRIEVAVEGIQLFDDVVKKSSTISNASMDINGAQVKVHANAALTQLPISERVELRVAHLEESRQLNAESVVQKTALALGTGDVEEPSEKVVDQDWVTRFFGIVQDISDEDLQNLWALVLKGEVLRPGRFSLRTLEILKQISKKEAEVFSRVAQHVLDGSNIYFLIRDELNVEPFGIETSEMSLCVELGLLHPNTYVIADPDSITKLQIRYGKRVISIDARPDLPVVGLSGFFLTVPGAEIASLIPKDNKEYLSDLMKYLNQTYVATLGA